MEADTSMLCQSMILIRDSRCFNQSVTDLDGNFTRTIVHHYDVVVGRNVEVDGIHTAVNRRAGYEHTTERIDRDVLSAGESGNHDTLIVVEHSNVTVGSATPAVWSTVTSSPL